MKKVCFITSGHISTNPRLVKEASALDPSKYQIFIVSTFYQPELLPFDQAILQAHPQWTHLPVPYTLCEKLLHRLGRYLFYFWGFVHPYAISKVYRPQVRVALQIAANLYIAHNLGALPVAALVAKKSSVKYAFDAEDFHRGESPELSKTSKLATAVEQKFFSELAYLTTASPLINEKYRQLYPKLNPTAINNVFSKAHQPPFHTLPPEPLKLFWFSQTVGLNRGLQDVLFAMQFLPDIPIQVTLVGFCTKDVEEVLKGLLASNQHQLNLIPLITENRLFEMASEHHIGLALELSTPLNRDICLTNKIFTYLMSGNAIIASDTQAQKAFMAEHLNIGWVYPQGQVQTLSKVLKNCHTKTLELEQVRRNAYDLAQEKLNWEIEQKKWSPLVQAALYN